MAKKSAKSRASTKRKFRSAEKMLAAVERDLESDEASGTVTYVVNGPLRKPRPIPLLKVFEFVLWRPDMFMDDVSVASIRAFMDGFCYAREPASLHRTHPFIRFFESLWDRFGHRREDVRLNWVRILRLNSTSEAGAVDLLRRLWCEHRAGKRQFMPELHSKFGPKSSA